MLDNGLPVRPGERNLLKPYVTNLSSVGAQDLAAARENLEKLAHEIPLLKSFFMNRLRCADPADPARLTLEGNDIDEIVDQWNKKTEGIHDLSRLNRDVELVIERGAAAANLPAAQVVFPGLHEVPGWWFLPDEEEAVNVLEVRQNETFQAGINLSSVLRSDSLPTELNAGNFAYPTAHEAISMAGRHLSCRLGLNLRCATSSLSNPMVRAGITRVLAIWFQGLDECRNRLSVESENALAWLSNQVSRDEMTPEQKKEGYGENYDRDEWLWQNRSKMQMPQLERELEEIAPQKKWTPIGGKAIEKAIERYCLTFGERKPQAPKGRPRKTT